jgi:hypothetical protein
MRLSVATFLIFALVSFGGCFNKTSKNPNEASTTETATGEFAWPVSPHEGNPVEELIFQTNFSEDMILQLSPTLKIMLAKLNGASADLSSLFTETIQYSGPKSFEALAKKLEENTPKSGHISKIEWPVEPHSEKVSPDGIWANVLKSAKFEEPQFGVLSGTPDYDANVFVMKTIFESRFKDDAGRHLGVKAHQTLEWKPIADGVWKISDWRQDDFKITYAPTALFENVTRAAIPLEATFESVTKASHDEIIANRFEDASKTPVADPDHPFFSDWESSFQYPAASVVDVDGDQ